MVLMNVDTFKSYQTFVAMKLHFSTESYDYFKYHGKTKAGWKSFEKFGGKKVVYFLARKWKENYVPFLAHGFAYHPDSAWIGDFNSPDMDDTFKTHQKNIQALSHIYKKELTELLNTGNVKSVMVSHDGELPLIERNRINGLTSIESCCIMDHVFNYIDSNECDHPLWEKARVVKKFAPFLKIDTKKYIGITKQVFNDLDI